MGPAGFERQFAGFEKLLRGPPVESAAGVDELPQKSDIREDRGVRFTQIFLPLIREETQETRLGIKPGKSVNGVAGKILFRLVHDPVEVPCKIIRFVQK